MSADHNVFHAAVFLIIRDDEGRILLHQRAGTNFLPGYWDFPSGHVEDGESFAAAAARELQEETSLTVEPQDLRMVHASINHTDLPYINIVFAVSKWQGTPTIVESHKCSGMDFFAEDALPDKLTLAVRNLQVDNFNENLNADVFVDSERFVQIMGEPFKLVGD
jgi:mutator protein MutT